MAPVDVVVVAAPVRAAAGGQHLHNRYPQCRVSANPGCKWRPFHQLDNHHTGTHHPICSNNTATECLEALGLVVSGLAWELVLDLVMAWELVLDLVTAWVLVTALVLASAPGPEHQGNLHLRYKS